MIYVFLMRPSYENLNPVPTSSALLAWWKRDVDRLLDSGMLESSQVSQRFDAVVVNRETPFCSEAYMKTISVEGYIQDESVLFDADCLTSCSGELTSHKECSSAATEVPHVLVQGEWHCSQDTVPVEENILGGFGCLQTDASHYDIPVVEASEETLGYYGAQLIRQGMKLPHVEGYLPITVMMIGPKYPENYLMTRSEENSGHYIEWHNAPHFHAPIHPSAAGFLLLGKQVAEQRYHLTFFKIPYGTGIFTPAHVLHNDSFLVGYYLVCYRAEPHFSTVLFRHQGLPTTISPLLNL